MIETINRWLILLVRIVSGCAFVFMATIAFVDSIGRKMNKPLLGGYEYVELALMTFFFASIALVVRDDAHIRIGLFSDLYKPRLARWERYFTGILEALAMIVFAWMIFDQADRLARFGTLSTHFRIPMAPWVYMAAVLSLVAVWFAVWNVWHVHKSAEPRPHAIPDEEK